MAKKEDPNLAIYTKLLTDSGEFTPDDLEGMDTEDLKTLCDEMNLLASPTKKAASAPAPVKKGKVTPPVVEEEEEEDDEDEDDLAKVATSKAAKAKAEKRADTGSNKMETTPFSSVLKIFPLSEGYTHNALARGVTIKKGGKGVVSLDYFKTVDGKVTVGNLYFNALKGKEQTEAVLGEDFLEDRTLSCFSPNLWFVKGLTIKECVALLNEIKDDLASKANKAAKAAKENMAKMRDAQQKPATAPAAKGKVYEAEEDEEVPVTKKKKK